MTLEEKRRDLARYRLQQAEECLDEGRYLLEGGKSERSAVNRGYYAMFYAVLSLLVFERYSSSKHSGVIGYFNREFVRSGRVSKELGRAINQAFELRQRADYREDFEIPRDQALRVLDDAAQVVRAARAQLEGAGRL